jgi:hypothetical protein
MKKVSRDVELYGSAPAIHTPAITANSHFQIAPEDNSSEAKYLPYNHFVIHNASTSAVLVTVQDRPYIVSAGTTREEYNIFFHVMDILELGGANITAGELRIEVNRAPINADSKALLDAEKQNGHALGWRAL